MKGHKQKARHVPETSNLILQEQDLRVQNPLASGSIQTVVQGSTATITVPKLAGTLQDLGPSIVALSILHSLVGVPPDHVEVGPGVMEICPITRR